MKDHWQPRLWAAMRRSYLALEPYRKRTLADVEQFVGLGYGPESALRGRVPVPFLGMAATTYENLVCGGEPKFMVDTAIAEQKDCAARLGLALDRVAAEANLARTLRASFQQALFVLGVVKVGVDSIKGGVFIEPVLLEDFVMDMGVKDITKAGFIGHRYFVSQDEFLAAESLQGDKDREPVLRLGPRSDDIGQGHSLRAVGQDEPEAEDDWNNLVCLWEVYLPRERRTITLSYDGARLYSSRDYVGQAAGPYHFLSFQEVVGNLMPLPPVALWRDLHELANDLFRKLANQSRRQKKVIGYRPGSEDDAKRVKDVADGEMIAMHDPAAIHEFALGGVSQENVAMFSLVQNLFNWFGGNVDALAGLGPQSGTVGQDALLTQSSNRRLEVMRQRTLDFLASVGGAVADELWNDPTLAMNLVKRTPVLGIEIPVRFDPESRQGWLQDYAVTVSPYSVRHEPPEAVLAKLSQILSTYIMPLVPVLQAQGGVVNMQALVALVAKAANLPELNNLIVFEGQPSQPGDQNEARAPAGPAREYVRRNVSGPGTFDQRNTQFAQMFAGMAQPKAS